MILPMMFWSDDQTGPKLVSSCANGYVPEHRSTNYLLQGEKFLPFARASEVCRLLKVEFTLNVAGLQQNVLKNACR